MMHARSDRPRRLARGAAVLAAGVLLSACAPRAFRLPPGPGTPLPGYAAVFAEAAAVCRGVHTLSAEVAISGRAGAARLRGRLHAGLARPDSLYVEGLAPFGRPLFILGAQGGRGTLVLPRDRRFVADADPAALVETLAGVALDPADLLAVLTGCVAPDPQPRGGVRHPRGPIEVDLGGQRAVYIREVRGRYEVMAARLPGLLVEYLTVTRGLPREIRLRTADSAPARAGPVDLVIAIPQLEVNVPIAPTVFRVEIPPDALPISLDELRVGGPLGTE